MNCTFKIFGELVCAPHLLDYILKRKFQVRIKIDGKEHDFIIPVGYDWDGASVPRLFWRIAGTPFDPWTMKASVVHDWLYWNQPLSRAVADALLRDIIIEGATKAFKDKTHWPFPRKWWPTMNRLHASRIGWTYYFGVRLGGWIPWNKYRKENKEII